MKQLHIFSILLLTIIHLLWLSKPNPSQANSDAIPLTAVSDSMQIYYKYSQNGLCYGPITLGDFIKHTLPFEWGEFWANTSGGMESLKAGAIAIRSFTVSVYNSSEVTVNGQKYLCTRADWQNFKPNESLTPYPNSVQAVNATTGIILTHSDATAREESLGRTVRTGTIDARYTAENGDWTQGDSQRIWLKSIYDPVSTGVPPSNPTFHYGMGQHGSKRWAWGESASGQEYPKWDYRRILAHYYQHVDFVGILPDPPDNYRSNMLQIINGIPPQGNFTMQKGEERTGIGVLWQNTGHWVWPANSVLPGDLCPANTTYYTLVGYHLYRQNGTPACANCIGIRRTPICRSGQTLGQGEYHWLNGFHVYIPDDPTITPGTYLLRFDVEHRYNSVWEGYTYGFTWPPQDIPVQIIEPPDNEPPDNPDNLDSGSSHAPNNWSKDNTVYAEWSGASDNRTPSGQLVYSVDWTASSSTVPNTSVDETDANATSPALSNGNWYLHVRTRDNAGNWNNGAVHFGPFLIDTAQPSGVHDAPEWSSTADFTVTWNGFDTGGSGIHFDFDYYRNSGSWQNWFETTAASGSVTYNLGANPNDVIFIRSCMRDGAGNIAAPDACTETDTQFRNAPYLNTDPAQITHCFTVTETVPYSSTLLVKNEGPDFLDWTIAISHPNLSLSPTSGVDVNSGFPAQTVYTLTNPAVVGQHTGVITVGSPTPGVSNNPFIVPVMIRVAPDVCFRYYYFPLIFKQN